MAFDAQVKSAGCGDERFSRQLCTRSIKLVFRKDAEFEDWLSQHHNNETSAKSVEESLFATTRKS
jgi:hypothetical protein